MSLFLCQFVVIFWKYSLIVLARNENGILMYVWLDVFLCDPCPLFYKFICSFISFISSVPRDPVYGNLVFLPKFVQGVMAFIYYIIFCDSSFTLI